MVEISRFEVFATDLPFKKPFKHAAAERSSSYSLFLRCDTSDGHTGYGECLPREYVTGESRDGAIDMLQHIILPKLLGQAFLSMQAVVDFLEHCNGSAPVGWVESAVPQTAAWSVVDLALLDAFGQSFGVAAMGGDDASWPMRPQPLRYSGVVSSDSGMALVKTAVKMRLFGLKSIKLKVDRDTPLSAIGMARRIFGSSAHLRADANMAWNVDDAALRIEEMKPFAIESIEQPIAASDLAGLAELVRRCDVDIMVDESLSDAASMRKIIEQRACTAVNVRISKCGGLIAARNRCREALNAGLKVQIGCQVGESSLLSAAQMALIADVVDVTYIEGCFGLLLLREDPAIPQLTFGRGGRPPSMPTGSGLGITVDDDMLARYSVRREIVDGS